MICAASTHTRDILFHVIYGNDEKMIVDFIRAGASRLVIIIIIRLIADYEVEIKTATTRRLYSITGCEDLNKMVGEIVNRTEEVGINKLRALFFIVLNMDMPLKEYICEPNDVKLYSVAMGLPSSSKNDVSLMHSYSMIGTKKMEPPKAKRFMLELRDSINSWLANERLTCSDLVTKIKEEYLVS